MRRFFLKLSRRRALERDLQAELAFHHEMAAANNNPVGLGNTSQLKEASRDVWHFNLLENLWRDVVYATRSLRRSPALVATAVISLALGIGANATIFSLAVEFLFSEPSVRDAASLSYARMGGNSHAPPSVVDFVARSGVFAEVAGENEESLMNWNDGAQTRPINAMFTTKNYFTAMGLPVALGRAFTTHDTDQVVVLSDHFWRSELAADPAAIGRTLRLNGSAYTIVGVLPNSYRSLLGFGFSPEIVAPAYLDDTLLAIYSRLQPGVSLTETHARLQLAAQRLDREFPGPFKWADNVRLSAVAGAARFASDHDAVNVGIFFLILIIVVGLVVLIACVNVAGLLLARAVARRREIAIRLSLGAGRGRLLAQLLVESLLLCMLGTAAGLVLAQSVSRMIERIQLPLPIPIHLRLSPDWRLAIYSACLILGTTLACGLLPAWQSTREAISGDLVRESKMRLRRVLVAAQIAVAVLVLSTGFLFLRNLFRANAISPGFDVRHTVRAAVNLPPDTYDRPEALLLYVNRALTELRAIPGVESVAAARIIPFNDATNMGGLIRFPDTGEVRRVLYNWNAVTPDYFRAMKIPLRDGRVFTETDGTASQSVVVNPEFVRQYLGGRAAVGTTFDKGPNNWTQFRIVGVVEGTRNLTIGEEDRPQLYQPLVQGLRERKRLSFVLRSSVPPAAQLEAVRTALRGAEPAAGLEVATMYASIGLAFLPSQIGAALMGSVGLLGLILATAGLYGTLVYAVTRRTREIGVRMAIGATPGDIRSMVLADSLKPVVVGSVLGLVIALFVTKPLAMFLVPGLSPGDPASFSAVILVLAATASIASWGPVRRALAVDPVSSLRQE